MSHCISIKFHCEPGSGLGTVSQTQCEPFPFTVPRAHHCPEPAHLSPKGSRGAHWSLQPGGTPPAGHNRQIKAVRTPVSPFRQSQPTMYQAQFSPAQTHELAPIIEIRLAFPCNHCMVLWRQQISSENNSATDLKLKITLFKDCAFRYPGLGEMKAFSALLPFVTGALTRLWDSLQNH